MKKKTTKKSPKKAIQREEDRWIDVYDNAVMRKMGFLRPLKQSPRDESVWTRTPHERRILNNVKHYGNYLDMHFHSVPRKRATVFATLIIQLKKNKVFPKSTYSIKCFNNRISDILGQFKIVNPKTKQYESAVAKYSYNGMTYAPNETPYFG